MGVTATIDGGTIATVRIESVELTESADLGAVGIGHFTIDDTPGTLATAGWKDVVVEEDDCSDPLMISGFLGARRIKRGTHRSLRGRDIECDVKDLNDLLQRYVIRGGWKRPEESVGDRVAALLASPYLSSLVVDSGFVVYPDEPMDANDYRFSSKPGDVLGDCATRVGFNYFVYPEQYDGIPSLWFDSPGSSNYSSTLQFSNIAADIDWETTFPVSPEATLNIDPESVFSRVLLNYKASRVFRTRAATATDYVQRDGIAPTSSVKKRAQAIVQADLYLQVHKAEEHMIDDVILVTSSKVNLIKAGMRIQGLYSHMDPEGYSSLTWFRILECTKRFIISPGGIPEAPDEPLYALAVKMEPQVCEPLNPDDITLAQVGFKGGELGTTVSLPAPATAGSLLVVVLGNRDEISLGPVGVPETGWNYVPLVGSPFHINYVQADYFNGSYGCECGHGTLYWKQAAGGEQDYPIDNQMGATFAEFSGFTQTIVAIDAAAAESSNNQVAAVSLTSDPGVPSLVVGALITRIKSEGSFAPGAGITVPLLVQSYIDGAGTSALLYGTSNGSPTTFSGTMSGPYKDDHPAWGMRMAAFTQECP